MEVAGQLAVFVPFGDLDVHFGVRVALIHDDDDDAR